VNPVSRNTRHVIIGVSGGKFISMTGPPQWAAGPEATALWWGPDADAAVAPDTDVRYARPVYAR